MCKCGEKSDDKSCKENTEEVEAELEQKTKCNCTGDQLGSGRCSYARQINPFSCLMI
jgi:hypothetical protein